MTPQLWEKIGEIYHAASELAGEERAAYLASACGDDEELRREVESLLAAADGTDSLIDRPVLDAAAALVVGEESVSLSGRSLGPYRIEKRLGTGGIGEVYLALDTRLGREVALKTLSSSFASDPHWLQRLQTEASAAATLNHPNIATIYSVETIEGHHFITMEYVDGELLGAAIPAEGFDLQRFFNLFRPLADALVHAHSKGITHRDLKPGNIMIAADGTPKLLDFGLARIEREVESSAAEDTAIELTRAGQILGTPAYMAPEQARGEPVDQRADIFSFGVVMYEALTGRRPFRGESYAAIISEVLMVDPPPVSDLKAEIPDLLARMISRCLNKDRRARLQTMREVAALLEEASLIIQSPSRMLLAGAYSSARRRLTTRALITSLLVLVAALAAFAARGWMRPSSAPPTEVRFAIAPPEPGAGLSTAQLSPDGRMLVYPASAGEETQLYLRRLDRFEAEALPGTEGAQHPFFSPDGEWVGFFIADETKLKKIRVTGGVAMTICDACPVGLDADWGEDGTIVVATSEGGLYRLPAGGGRPEVLTQVDAARGDLAHRMPQILDDGKLIYSRQTGKGLTLVLFDLGSGAEEELLELEGASRAIYLESGHLLFSRSNQIFAMPFDLARKRAGGEAVPVLDGAHVFSNFQIARNGTLAYLPNAPMRENALVWVDRKGQATPIIEKQGDYRSPRLSPDGRRIAVEVERDIWVFEIASGRGVRLTFEDENRSPVWMPDGRSVIYATSRGGSWTISRQDAGGGQGAERLHTSEYHELPYTIHPGGDELIIAQTGAGSNTDLLRLSLSSRRIEPFIGSPFIESTPRLSPDGRWLAYFSDESGRPEVYLQAYPGPGARLPVSRGGGTNPVWSSDGRRLYYRWQSRLYEVDVATRGEGRVGVPRALFAGRYLTSYDVAPDGERFLMVRNEQGLAPRQIHIAINWIEELKRRL